jgi:hypothetical protein
MSETYTYIVPPPGSSGTILRESDQAFIPLDPANRDYQEFLSWIDAGNPAPEGWTGPTNEVDPNAN